MLKLGTRLGSYEVLTLIGAGGMGEVYSAHDHHLDRKVALKTLPERLANDPEALGRFEREARAIAALNHPNILGIHDMGREGDVVYIVMELLEGESLRSRLSAGPLPPRKATELAIQMAHGLSAAHTKGIIHRDLKPENLFISRDGRLKILDFGLAKLTLPRASSADSPTESLGVLRTDKGMILGTLGYMSPEQVRGEAVDARSDLFSFGVVLFEMLTGVKAFVKATPSDTMAAILRDDPAELDNGSGRALPLGLRRILEHCMEKDPAHRFHDAQDLAFALESASGDSGTASSSALPVPRAPWNARLLLLGGFAAGAALAAAALFLRPAPSRTTIPVALRFLTYSGRDTSPASSPDGKTIAFTSGRDGMSRIWLKQLRGGGEVSLSAGPDDFPRFSPDGSSILFIRSEGSGASLYRMSVLGTDIHKVVENAADADWSPDGERIAFIRILKEGGSSTTILYLINASGGAEKELARFPAQLLTAPRWSPDGSALALTTHLNAQGGLRGKIIRVSAKDGSFQEHSPAGKFGALSSVVWVSDEEVIYSQAESVTGNGVALSPSKTYRQNLATDAIQPLFWAPCSATIMDLLPDGRLLFDGMSGRQALREYPLTGKGQPRWLTRGNSNDRQPVFSSGGEWVVFSSNRSGNLDLWAVSSRTGVVKSLTDDAAEDWDPGSTPDGQHILWSSNRSGAFEIWIANTDGSGARQVSHDGVDAENPTMTRDGNWIVYTSTNPKQPGMWKVHPDGTGAELVVSGTSIVLPEVSPDGQFVVYDGQESSLHVTLRVVRLDSGKEVFRTPVTGSHKTVATMGRTRWTPDGAHLIFTGQDEAGLDGVFIQDFVPGTDTRATRKPLAGFDPDWITESLGISPDGSHLVLSESERMFSILVAENIAGLPARKRSK